MRMLLLAEAGSTKTSWRLATPTSCKALPDGDGLNLNVLGDDGFAQAFGTYARQHLAEYSSRIAEVVFYGPSVSTPQQQQRVEAALKASLPAGCRVEAQHDLLAAARAALAESPGWVGILGTGSNAARYDGQRIVAQCGGYGYLLGDEGSGFDLGRRFLNLLLRSQLPVAVQNEFENWAGMSLADFRHAVYAHPRPNARVAAVAGFATAHLAEPAWMAQVVEAFQRFLETSLFPLMEAPQTSSWTAVGSVALHYRPALAQACRLAGAPQPSLLPSPIEALVRWHQQRGIGS